MMGEWNTYTRHEMWIPGSKEEMNVLRGFYPIANSYVTECIPFLRHLIFIFLKTEIVNPNVKSSGKEKAYGKPTSSWMVWGGRAGSKVGRRVGTAGCCAWGGLGCSCMWCHSQCPKPHGIFVKAKDQSPYLGRLWVLQFLEVVQIS